MKIQKLFKGILGWFDDILIPRQLATVIIKYHSVYARQNPVLKEYPVIARVRRTASPDEVEQALFKLTPPKNTIYKVVDIKIFPITKMPKV